MLMNLIIAIFVALSAVNAALAADAPVEKPLPFGKHEEVNARVESAGAGAVRIKFAVGKPNAMASLKPAEGTWNLDQASAVLVDVRNRGAKPAALFGRFDNSKWTSSLLIVPLDTIKEWWYIDIRINVIA